ncbi:MAG: hypothetical protein GY754_35110 [bacterium]|nr:hypothetical protein [bacterium]
MARGEDLFEYEHLPNSDAMVGVILAHKIEPGEASTISSYATRELRKYPEFSNYILDIRNLNELSSSVLSVLMDALTKMQRTGRHLILIIEESFFEKITYQYPEMFDSYSVFYTIEDAIDFLNK